MVFTFRPSANLREGGNTLLESMRVRQIGFAACERGKLAEWKMETGKWKLETGKWKLENGNWKLENENWKLGI